MDEQGDKDNRSVEQRSEDRRYGFRREMDRLRYQQQQALLEATKLMNGTLDLDRLLELIMSLATKNLSAERSTL